MAAELTNNAADSDRLPALLEAVKVTSGELPQQALADAGFRAEASLEKLAATPCDVIVALGREGRAQAVIDAVKYPHTAAMAERLQSEPGKAAYRRRKAMSSRPTGGSKLCLDFGNSVCAACKRSALNGSSYVWR